VDVKLDPERSTRRHDEQALEEIRLLFARYRQTARHGRAVEREEHATARTSEREEAARPTER
jgi:hypothetical protein